MHLHSPWVTSGLAMLLDEFQNRPWKKCSNSGNSSPGLFCMTMSKILFRVFLQCLDNQGEFGNGTAATVYIKCNATPLVESVTAELKKTWAAGLLNPLTELNIMGLANKLFPRIETHETYHVLHFLLESPQFDLKTYFMKMMQLSSHPCRWSAPLRKRQHYIAVSVGNSQYSQGQLCR